MKRVINALNDFEFFEKLPKKYKSIRDELAKSIIELATINSKYATFNLEKLNSYLEEKHFSKLSEANQGKIEINQEYEEMFDYIDTDKVPYILTTEILYNVNDYIKNSMLDKIKLCKIIKNKIKNIKMNAKIEKIKNINKKYFYDLNYTKINFVKDMLIALKEIENNIVNIIGVSSFLYYTNAIKNKNELEEFITEKLKEYIDFIYEKGDLKDDYVSDNLEQISKYSNQLGDYIKNKKLAKKREKITKIDDVIELLIKSRDNDYEYDTAEFLEIIDAGTYKKYMIESSVFLEEIVNLIRWDNRISGNVSFEKVIEKIMGVLQELEKDKRYSLKIKKIMESYKIKRQ